MKKAVTLLSALALGLVGLVVLPLAPSANAADSTQLAKQYATQLLNNSRVSFINGGRADLESIAKGGKPGYCGTYSTARVSPTVEDSNLLGLLVAATGQWSFTIGAVTSNHHCDSGSHQSGRAIDLNRASNGTCTTNFTFGSDRGCIAQFSAYLDRLAAANGMTQLRINQVGTGNSCGMKASTYAALTGLPIALAGYSDSCNHLHVGPLNGPAGKVWNVSAYSISGGIGQLYYAPGGPSSFLGAATSNEIPLGNGNVYQTFQNGTIYWTSATAAHSVHGSIKVLYDSLRAENGFLRFPTSEEISLGGANVYQTFQGGTIYYTPTLGAHVVGGGVKVLYDALRAENGFLGYPTSNELPLGNDAVYQTFERGTIYWTPSLEAHVVGGGIKLLYDRLRAENGFLGFPTSNEISLGGDNVYQTFQGGTIYWTPTTDAHAVRDKVKVLYDSLRAENGFLGYPTSDELPLGDGALYQTFQGGTIYYTPTLGAHVVGGGVKLLYDSMNAEHSYLGFPTSDEIPLGGGAVCQTFQGGKITWYPTTGATASRS